MAEHTALTLHRKMKRREFFQYFTLLEIRRANYWLSIINISLIISITKWRVLALALIVIGGSNKMLEIVDKFKIDRNFIMN